ncbi:MAG: hypothetical protein WDN45_01840 [Caulobacteraceae bacterium]
MVNIQTDGDMNFTPGVLWTEAHHRLPVLSIMHNNRAWHQELMFLEFMAGGPGGAARIAPRSARPCATRSSNTPRWPRPTASRARGRSRIPSC